MSQDSVLITGAAGFIGFALAHRLLQRGRPGLCVLLAVPGADRPLGRGASRAGRERKLDGVTLKNPSPLWGGVGVGRSGKHVAALQGRDGPTLGSLRSPALPTRGRVA